MCKECELLVCVLSLTMCEVSVLEYRIIWNRQPCSHWCCYRYGIWEKQESETRNSPGSPHVGEFTYTHQQKKQERGKVAML